MKTVLQTKDFAVSQESYELRYNEDLDMLYTHPVPGDLSSYYQSEAYISHTDSRKGLSNWLYQLIKKWSIKIKLDIISTYVKNRGTLLDIGAGTGDFVLGAQNSGWSAHGTEPMEEARKKARAKGLKLNSNLSGLSDKKFEVITLWHVLEHLPELHKALDELLAKLEKKGILIIAVPNYNSWDARHYGKHWAAYDVPRHLWHFSRISIERLFSKRGFKLAGTHPLWFDAFYICLLSEKYKHGKTNYLRAFINGMRSNWAARRSKEYSSLIYVLQRSDQAK